MKVHRYGWPPIRPHTDDDDCPVYEGEEEAAIRAFERHLDEHGCAGPNTRGFAYCPEAMALLARMPDAERVVLA